MSPTPRPGDQSLDAPTAEAVLGSARPSGDAALDAVLDSLRDLGNGPAPEPTGELAALLGASGSAPASVASARAARARRARNAATGTTAVAGILLVTATAAAALGTLREAQSPARPTLPPAVVVPARPELPHPAGTDPADLPAVPAAATLTSGRPSTPAHRHATRPSPLGATPRRVTEDGDSREAGTEGEDAPPEQHAAGSSHEGDDAPEPVATGGSTHEDDDSDHPSSTSTSGSHDGDGDGSRTSTGDDGDDGGSDGGDHSGDAALDR